MPLEALLLELLDGDNNADARLRGRVGVLVDPSFENAPESSFPQIAVRAEVLRGGLEIVQSEGFQGDAGDRMGR